MNRPQFKPQKKYKSQNKKKKSLGSKVKKKKKLIIDGIFVRTANEKIYDFIISNPPYINSKDMQKLDK